MQMVAAPTLFVVVFALPKGALVEKQVLLHTGRFVVEDEDGDLEVVTQLPTFQEGENIFRLVERCLKLQPRKYRWPSRFNSMGVFTLR